MIGIFGGLRFRINDSKVLTFQNFKHELSYEWNTIDRIGIKPLVEFGGAKLQTITFDIILDASLGIKPRPLIKMVERMADAGEAYELIIGCRRVSRNKWVITKYSQAWDRVLRDGELYKAKISLSLQEYV